jgi:hypothetical protein
VRPEGSPCPGQLHRQLTRDMSGAGRLPDTAAS